MKIERKERMATEKCEKNVKNEGMGKREGESHGGKKTTSEQTISAVMNKNRDN